MSKKLGPITELTTEQLIGHIQRQEYDDALMVIAILKALDGSNI